MPKHFNILFILFGGCLMKKRIHLIVGISTFFAIVIMLLFIIPTPNIILADQAIVAQMYDNNVNFKLSDEDTKKIKEMFAGKWCYLDNPSCGFNENVYIQIGINKFLPACDGCAIVKNGNKYFALSEQERKTLDRILKKYGIKFPCV